MELICGVYKIEDVETGYVYVGSANKKNGIKKRWSNHKSRLKNNDHDYEQLQEAYNNNPSRIKYEILEVIDDETELEEREQYWKDYCSRIEGWTVINKMDKIVRKSNVKDVSKMKEAQRGSNNPRCKYDEENIAEIVWLRKNTDMKAKDIYNHYTDIRKEYIYQIGSAKWRHIKPIKPTWFDRIS